jgi:DNA-binding CsgD family transcriptional regulator
LLAPEIARAYHRAQARSEPVMEADQRLTAREREVLRWLREGKRNSEIGVILQLSERTVEKHVEHILAKLGVETRLAAALIPTAPPFESGAFHARS